MKKIFSLTALFSLFVVSSAVAQIPQTMSYQGVLTGADGNPVADGAVSLTFKLYDVATAGNALWEETQSLDVKNGIFNAILGSVNNFNLPFDKPYWLGMAIDGGSELAPRIQLTAAPYSLAAQKIVGTGEVVRRINVMAESLTDTVTIIGSGGTSVTTRGDTIIVASIDSVGGSGDKDWVDIGKIVYTKNKSIELRDTSGVARFEVRRTGNPYRLRAESNKDGIFGVSTGVGRGVRGRSDNGDGVRGESIDGRGVFGTSQEDLGVAGFSVESNGVAGNSEKLDGVFGRTLGTGQTFAGVGGVGINAPGVLGTSEKEDGVVGTSLANNGVKGKTTAINKAGVRGEGGDSSTGVEGISKERDGVMGSSTVQNGVFGVTQGASSLTSRVAGVHGQGGENAPGVYGFSEKDGVFGESSSGAGVHGSSQTDGVFGESPSGTGVHGKSTGGTGVFGVSITQQGVLGQSTSSAGVFGLSQTDIGVLGQSTSSTGVSGVSSTDTGVNGESTSGTGVVAFSVENIGLIAEGGTDAARFDGQVRIEKNGKLKIDNVPADPNEDKFVVWSDDKFLKYRNLPAGGGSGNTLGQAYNQGGPGAGRTVTVDNGAVQFFNSTGTESALQAGNQNTQNPFPGLEAFNAGPGPALFADGRGNGLAGFFIDNVDILGNLTKISGSFKIDHPLDPANKYLFHSFVESPDMMNIYNGNATLNGNGEAWVDLPEWFEALNQDFRYQLTCIGGFAQVYIAEKVQNNRFKIAGGTPGLEVSWQVTGIRHDPYAEQNRIQVEEEKTGGERGRYLYPDGYGAPKAMGMSSFWRQRASREQ